MNAEMYYVIGKPAYLKYDFFNHLSVASEKHSFLRIPRLFTTDEQMEGLDNTYVIDERDFLLRDSLGIYCLTWKKGDHHFGICAEGAQWVQNGYSVVMHGSLININQTLKVFPEMNVILLRSIDDDEAPIGNRLLESEGAHLDWVDSANGVCCPYILSFSEGAGIQSASELLTDFIGYNHNSVLDKVS